MHRHRKMRIIHYRAAIRIKTSRRPFQHFRSAATIHLAAKKELRCDPTAALWEK